MTTTTISHTNEQTALRALELICQGDTGPAVEDVIHPKAVNDRAPLSASASCAVRH